MSGHSERILDFITRFPGRDDDEISTALRITPRQTVNQVCRRLESSGLVRRGPGRFGKVANFPTGMTGANTPRRSTPLERPPSAAAPKPPRGVGKPPLPEATLVSGGFRRIGHWILAPDGRPVVDSALPKEAGVYAFVADGVTQYVGVASMGLAKRLYFYSRPGITQRTSQRINTILREGLETNGRVAVYVASPEQLAWNGLPVNGAAGLEQGLIEQFHLPWNIRGAG